jgi:hypothetical protein
MITMIPLIPSHSASQRFCINDAIQATAQFFATLGDRPGGIADPNCLC